MVFKKGLFFIGLSAVALCEGWMRISKGEANSLFFG
jgi:hypothetical protein